VEAPFATAGLRGHVRRLVVSEDAIAITEYGMLIALVALALLAVLGIFGSQISSWFARKTGNITTV
jgi:Flp pilus assembly pilin Flp